MDLSHYLPDNVPQCNVSQQRPEEGRKLKERFQNHAIELHQMGNELFMKVVSKRKLSTSIKSMNSVLARVTREMNEKLQHQNRVAQLVNAEQVKQRELQKLANTARDRMEENNRSIAENRLRTEGFGEFAVKFHDSIQTIHGEISVIDEEMRRYRVQEGELVKLNVELANAEAEYNETNNSIKVIEMQLAKLEMSNQKYLTDIEQLNDRKKEIEAVLKVHLDEKVKLQKELEDFSMESSLTGKLDEIDVVLEQHQTAMSEIQAKHTEDMANLQKEMLEAAEKNEAFQKMLQELDSTLTEQNETLDKVKAELELIVSGSNLAHHEDPVLLPLQVQLEEKKCSLSQMEEEISHIQDCLETRSSNDSLDESEIDNEEENNISNDQDETTVGDSETDNVDPDHSKTMIENNSLAVTTIRTSTPTLMNMTETLNNSINKKDNNATELDLDGISSCGMSVASIFSTTRGPLDPMRMGKGARSVRNGMSFYSQISQPTPTSIGNVRQGVKRKSHSMMLDVEVSSTQG